jgi:hypothetical protein
MDGWGFGFRPGGAMARGGDVPAQAFQPLADGRFFPFIGATARKTKIFLKLF